MKNLKKRLKLIFMLGIIIFGGIFILDRYTNIFTDEEQPALNQESITPSEIVGFSKGQEDEASKKINFYKVHYDVRSYIKRGNAIVTKIDMIEKISGNSMCPTICDGNFMLFRKYKQEGIITGEIIRFKRSSIHNEYITHRVIGFDGYWIITKGDTNPSQERIKKDQVTHKLIGVVYK